MEHKKSINFPFYLLLISVYPTISLFAANFKQMKPEVIIRPILFSFLLGIGAYFLLIYLYKDKDKAGVLTTLFVFMFFIYGRAFSYLVAQFSWATSLGNKFHIILVMLAIIIFALAKKMYEKANIFDKATITIVCLALLVIPSYQIGKMIIEDQTTFTPNGLEISAFSEDQTLPDIYHIIVDAYSRQDYLALLGYDNSAFINFLRNEGFYVADCSKSNYSRTALSLTSTLNLDYIWRIFPEKRGSDRDDAAIYAALSNNLVHTELQKLGYQFITTENGYPWSEHTKYANLLVKQKTIEILSPYIFPFEKLFFESSALRLIADFINLNQVGNGYILNGQHYEQVIYSLNYLDKIPKLPGPKYIYYHITVPHYPFIFSPDGTLLPEISGDEGYIRNIEFINNALKPILKNIIEESTIPPVIILQGDHGSMLNSSYRFHILYAMYLPYDNSGLYPTISPVNTYRLIFNQIFNTNFSILKDRSIQADIGGPFRKTSANLPIPANQCP